MRLKLEYEDDPVFATVKYRKSDYRALTLKINGKPFSVWVTLDLVYQFRRDDPDYMREIDRSLVAATMIFGGLYDHKHTCQYTSRADALAGHAKIVQMLTS